MTAHQIPDRLIRALQLGDADAFDRLADTFADDVEFTSAVTPRLSGTDDVISQLRTFQAAGRFSRATKWHSRPDAAGLVVTAEFPLDSFYARYEWALALVDGRVAGIVQSGVAQTEPLPPTPLRLNDEIAAALQIARDTRNPVIVAYINNRGQPSQAPRGTVQVYSQTQLALWAHNPKGGLVGAIAANPNVSLHYWGGIGTAYGGALLFQGMAHIDDDAATRDVVYNGSPASEQRSDPERHGCAVIVDLLEVAGFMAGTRYNMSSAQNPP